MARPSYSWKETDDLRRAVDLMNAGTFVMDRLVTHRFPLSRIAEGFETLEHKPADYIKGIVVP